MTPEMPELPGRDLWARTPPGSFEHWRELARPTLRAHLPEGHELRLPRELMKLLRDLALFRSDGRWELMTRLALRALTESATLLEDAADPDIERARRMQKSVLRDVHKMHAFVRFSEVQDDAGAPVFVAWFEPEHEILPRAAPFFVRRFANMNFVLATPDGAASWDCRTLRYIDKPQIRSAPLRDGAETLWRTYYRSICNLGRINPAAMRREMPQRYWKNLPEAAEIPPLLRSGAARLDRDCRTIDVPASAQDHALKHALAQGSPFPRTRALEACRRCSLWQRATQPVAGRGPRPAALMLVGEQPGNEEDLRGEPFIGPAGRLLDELLACADLRREEIFVTNAVKHFKWTPRGKRRLHQSPDRAEITACATWLNAEIADVRPRVIVALGASAALAVLGSREPISALRGRVCSSASGAPVLVTWHPAAILRASETRQPALKTQLNRDLEHAARLARDRGDAESAVLTTSAAMTSG